nr:esterase-like activity of phytase family protein [Streptomyces sp. SID10853]
MVWLTAATALLTTLGIAPAGAAGTAGGQDAAAGWQKVGGDALSGVSGIAYEGHATHGAGVSALVVHDNKDTGQQRLSRITLRKDSDRVSPVTWDGPEPVDLEAVEAVPGQPSEYLALASRGIVYHLEVTGSTAKVLDYAPLPAIGQGDNFESLALVSRNNHLAALWADRGAGRDRPATLYSASLSFDEWGQAQFGGVAHQAYRAAYPTDQETRHISDISVTDSGRILVSSAADAGDDGPFDSAVSDAGRVAVSGTGQVRVTPAASPTVLKTFPQHKIEGVECLPGTTEALLGTDDENLGGYVQALPLCKG